QAHAAWVTKRAADGTTLDADAAQAAHDQRTAAAKRVLEAWRAFDQSLRDEPELGRSPDVLAVFRLNDTLYSRANWFVDHPDTNRLPPLLAPDDNPADTEKRTPGAARAPK